MQRAQAGAHQLGVFPDNNAKGISFTITEFEKKFATDDDVVDGSFSKSQQFFMDKGCVGLCAWRQGQRDPKKYVQPDKMPGVICYDSLALAMKRKVEKGEKLFIVAKIGRAHV